MGVQGGRPSTPQEKHLQQLLAKESTQVPPFKLGVLLLLFAGKFLPFALNSSPLLMLLHELLPTIQQIKCATKCSVTSIELSIWLLGSLAVEPVLMAMVHVAAGVLVTDLGKNYVQCNSLPYWAIVLSIIPFILLITLAVRSYLVK